MAILHKCIFDRCHSALNGGEGAIAQEIKFTDDTNKDPCHEEAKKINIQYTCFHGCYTKNGDGYGTVLLMGAQSITFYYASTIDCQPSTIASSVMQQVEKLLIVVL